MQKEHSGNPENSGALLIHRRRLVLAGAVAPCAFTSSAAAQKSAPYVTPNEDLMQEHGLVGRVILIYGRAIELLNANQSIDLAHVGQAAQIIARVIHGHHEVEEEKIVFPALEKANLLKNLIATLRGQHSAARAITATIGNNANQAGARDASRRRELIAAMQNFRNMYEPHGAYEDTIVYPAFRQAVGPEEYMRLAEQFAQNERRMNGDKGIQESAAALGKIETALGIELARYTRQMESPVDPASAGSKRQ
jgi:hemerythrin-like domain-containing protein